MTGYKVFDIKNDQPLFIFHGINRSRVVPLNTWLKADKKMVTDGSCNTQYLSGFHIFPSYQAITDWCKTVKHVDERVVVQVHAKKTRPKRHSKHTVVLADHLIVYSEDWNQRVPLRNFAE